MYHSSASTASCSNKTIDVTHNQKLKTIEENSDGDVTNENEKLFAEQEEIPNIAHSNPIDEAKVAHTSNYEGLEPEPSKLSESVELYKQNKENPRFSLLFLIYRSPKWRTMTAPLARRAENLKILG